MKTNFILSKNPSKNTIRVILISDTKQLEAFKLAKELTSAAKQILEADEKTVYIPAPAGSYLVVKFDTHKNVFSATENIRKAGHAALAYIKKLQTDSLSIVASAPDAAKFLAFAEGLCLSAYSFDKYKTDTKKLYKGIKTIEFVNTGATQAQLNELSELVYATCKARDLVNEPVNFLTAEQLSEEFRKMAKDAKISIEVLNKSKIKSLKMGGLLSVNLGSPNPPTFTIMEYKPKGALNSRPLVLVGKGVVYDTGGLSLKPTPGSMDSMKCDMAGAAAVGAAIYAIAKNKLPLHVVCLVPATENRPGGNAYTPGDVITMYSGKTVEILNTDAEGRLILADALHYAKKYKPELVIDFATLTGAAARAIGKEGTVYMGNAADDTKSEFVKAGNEVYERLVEFPIWEEYGPQIKSDIADLKNLGGTDAGAITAGKFLEAFTDYEWLHFDIAAPAYLAGEDSYRSKNGTGVGVRLIYQYAKNYCLQATKNGKKKGKK